MERQMPKTVLIVEDNELNMKLFNDLVETRGHRIVQTRSGIEAVDLARKHRPDLILMDIQLPEVSGLEVTQWLKDDEELRTIPVVAEIMRGEIGFDGLIMSDDVSMNALQGPYDQRAAAIIDAGLDIVLHCNGELEQARAVASAAPALSGPSLSRAKAALAAIAPPQPFDADEGEREFAAVKAMLGAA